MKKIIWLSSYPKSGNTWMRAIISSLFFTEDGVFDFGLFEIFKLILECWRTSKRVLNDL